MPNQMRYFLVSLLSLSATHAMAIVTIDDFDVGENVIDPAASGFGSNAADSGLDPTRVLGGQRFAWARSVSGGASSLAVNAGGSGELRFSVPSGSSGAIQVGYGGSFQDPLLAEDFYANDQAGFEAIFAEAPANGVFYVAVNARNGQFFSPTIPLTGPGVYRIPYEDVLNEFGPDAVDMDLAAGVFWGIWQVAPTPEGATFAVTTLRTYAVPEPLGAWLSLSAALGALYGRRGGER